MVWTAVTYPIGSTKAMSMSMTHPYIQKLRVHASVKTKSMPSSSSRSASRESSPTARDAHRQLEVERASGEGHTLDAAVDGRRGGAASEEAGAAPPGRRD